MTNLLQPADVCWMRPLKLAYFRKWNEWLVNSPKTYTAAGNMRSPGYANVINWISEIWSDFDTNLLARSFDHCGLTYNRLADFHNQLQHFVNTHEIIDDVVPEEQGTTELDGFGEMFSDDLEQSTSSAIDSESDTHEHDMNIN